MSKILIIDSSDSNADLMSRYLSRSGYDVSTMPDSDGIQIKLKFFPPDLIIIDTDLKTNSGYDVCRNLKNTEEGKYIPILLMSVTEMAHMQTRALQAGADDFMCKNLENSIFLSKVKALLRIKQLSDQIKERYKELANKDNQIDMQLKMAKKVQRSLIRDSDFLHNNVRFISKYMPALDIGGDFYDIIRLNSDCVGVVIGDVSGHGISAALLTAMLNMLAKNLAPRFSDPAEFLFHMNNEFINVFDNTDNSMYACVFYAVIDTKLKKMRYSNAGQSLPFYVNKNLNKVSELEIFGSPVGLIKDFKYDSKEIEMSGGDTLLFYTDGLMDNIYKGSEVEFNVKIESLLAEMNNGLAPEVLVQSLLGVFYRYDVEGNKKYEMDDVSIIVCKINS